MRPWHDLAKARPSQGPVMSVVNVIVANVTVVNVTVANSAMKGKKRKGADEPKQPDPKPIYSILTSPRRPNRLGRDAGHHQAAAAPADPVRHLRQPVP
ncbi:hypothetical protein HaLaN_17513 [Haematococcus lacustris]|uniref:Uncharacterized protein n=1 Tax=Haematococcus lacustris TaxID=44745 RepID=A0A699ZWU1_HAELA|nr:hypothetical protein HaLaN_17513 [Haematococcus lacustris]